MAARITDIFPFLLIALLCVGIVEGGYKVLDYFVLRPPVDKTEILDTVAADKESTDKAGQKEKHDYQIILQRNLFGPPPGKGEPASAVALDYAENLKLSSLNIVLMGTINGGDGVGRAIILDKSSNKQDLYEKGDSIQGAFIKEILRGKVILVYNGKDEMLDMNEAAKLRPAPAPVGVASGAVKNGLIPGQAVSPRGTPRRVINRPRAIRPSRSIRKQ